jgi:putative SOS response-associated peptidase YedK
MCARYEVSAPPQDLADLFGLAAAPHVQPRWNAAPTQLLPVVRQDGDGTRHLDLLRWGLVPAWADDVKIGNKMINARAETAATKPSFRTALRKRRCLVPVTGFYEWTGPAGAKRASIFRRRDGRPFALAGLWDTWRGAGGEPVVSFTVLTTTANELVAKVHDRMPVIVDEAAFATWLDPHIDAPARLTPLLVPAPAASMSRTQVGPAVNDPRHDDPSCSAPAPAGHRADD